MFAEEPVKPFGVEPLPSRYVESSGRYSVWGCNDVCQDGDVYWAPQPDPANPLRYFDPNIPLEVAILLDSSTVWITVLHRDSPQPRINQFYYYIERDLIWVFAYDAKLIGKPLSVRVKFL